ncbi:MAG: hypothetical protein H8E32_09430 [Nitrospinae bacterium]|nr:hypothetical protein [Nitrospinota bacterium]
MTIDDPDLHEDEKAPPAKPGGLELIVIMVFLLFLSWGTYEFGIWIIKDGGKTIQETR